MSFRGQGYDPGFEISPCVAARVKQTLTADKAFETFGRCCLRNCHKRKRSQMRAQSRETAYNSLLADLPRPNWFRQLVKLCARIATNAKEYSLKDRANTTTLMNSLRVRTV